ncbi:MAG TPA: hypothetical protein PK813_07380 [Candidatus Hydrogenedens sp.]|nr:hypothetical protein [Candidatus Hydrogenedens sp.]
MKKYVSVIGFCLAMLMFVQGCEQVGDLSKDMIKARQVYRWWRGLQLAYSPKNVVFTTNDVMDGIKKEFRVWNRFLIGTRMEFIVQPMEEWIVVAPDEGVSKGPWDREAISVKLDNSVLGMVSNTSPLESVIKIKVLDGVEREVKVRVVSNLNVSGEGIQDRNRERTRDRLNENQREGNNNGGNNSNVDNGRNNGANGRNRGGNGRGGN